jgi:hypothetical protein
MFKISYKIFLLLPAAALCMIAPFIHKAGFEGTEYFSEQAFNLPLIVCGAALLIALISGRYGSLAMFAASFTSLLSFAHVSYLYLSSVFFNGLAPTIGGMLEQIGFQWSFCAFAYLGAMLISIVSMFLPDSDVIG